MGMPSQPLGVKYFVAVMYTSSLDIEPVLKRLDERFGVRECIHGPKPFSWSEYYASEMGDFLQKMYICYETTADRSELPSIKLFTNAIEDELAVNAKRLVNIDPGYISRDKVVLATTKDFYHRLYLSDGIYAEVTLHYKRGQYRYFSWTYPDYRQPEIYQLFERARATLVKGLRNQESNLAADAE
jgi:hypothetical protein